MWVNVGFFEALIALTRKFLAKFHIGPEELNLPREVIRVFRLEGKCALPCRPCEPRAARHNEWNPEHHCLHKRECRKGRPPARKNVDIGPFEGLKHLLARHPAGK